MFVVAILLCKFVFICTGWWIT